MDMNWIDEIRDPEPRKRYIYNADDYDPQYGDPYYREHSTRADSLWRLYEESGTSITFDAFADESRQTDYRMETGALLVQEPDGRQPADRVRKHRPMGRRTHGHILVRDLR